MTQAVVHNGSGFWNGKGWTLDQGRAAVFPTEKAARASSKATGGTVRCVSEIVLRGDPVNQRVVERRVPLEFAYVVWQYTSLEPGHTIGCFDEESEAMTCAQEAMVELKARYLKCKFVEVAADTPCVKLWHGKWDQHVAILKLKVQ